MSVNEAVRQLLDVIKTRDFKEESPGKLIEKPRNAVSKFKKKKERPKHLNCSQHHENCWKSLESIQMVHKLFY